MKPAPMTLSLEKILKIFNLLSMAPRSKRSVSQKLAIESLLERIRDVGRLDDKKGVFACADSEAFPLKHPFFVVGPDGKYIAHPKGGDVMFEEDGETPKKRWEHTVSAQASNFPAVTITEREQQAVVLVLADMLADDSVTNEAIYEVMRVARWLDLHARLDALAEALEPKADAKDGKIA